MDNSITNDKISIVFDNKDDCDKWCSIEYDHWWWISVWWKAKRENEKMVTINKTRDDQTFYEYLNLKDNNKMLWRNLSKEPKLI